MPAAEGRQRQRLGEMTLEAVEARAAELSASAGVPAMAARMAPVASAWRGLAETMRREGAATVAELPAERLRAHADRLWLVPPGRSLI